MSKPRLNRLFNARSGRALDVAVDHGAFHEPS
ncbi:MAG: aldolase, partial [Microbacterium sp.]|nr:aldolase [Microbacterium sp.]